MVKKTIHSFLKEGKILVIPGVYDGLTARIAEKAGFEVIVMGGYSVAAARLGQPDVGYLTMTEMCGQIKMISAAVSLPLIADGDTGYGNPMNVMRTVREYERAGASGMLLEDQLWPKRCGHMEGKQVIPMEEHVQKIRAAVEARSSGDFLLIARTDALRTHGLEEAVRRGRSYREAGADVIFVEAPRTVDELRQIGEGLKGIPIAASLVEGGKTPLLTARELERLGYCIVFFGLTAVFTVARAWMDALTRLKAEGTTNGILDRMLPFSEFNSLIGLDEFSELEKKWKVVGGK
jgi:2-methylisocitrate lyase-like PEP mutase family enzyme